MQLKVISYRLVCCVLVGSLLSFGPLREAKALFGLFEETSTSFEGRYIDSLPERDWRPPLARTQAETAKGSSSNARSANDLGRRDDGESWAGNEPQSSERASQEAESAQALSPSSYRDGLTLMRVMETGLLDAPAVKDYLMSVAERLLEQSPIKKVPVSIVVTSGTSYAQAKAMPDGVIGIPITVIQLADSEDEVAALLAHEISHVILEHHDSDWYQQQQARMFAAAQLAMVTVKALSEHIASDSDIGRKIEIGLLIAEGALLAGEIGLFPSWTREQEDLADLLGLDLMIAAGYNYDGMFQVMRRLEAAEMADDARQAKMDRFENLNQEIKAEVESGNFGAIFTGLFSGLGLAFSELTKDLKTQHPSALERQESLFEYFDTRYGDIFPPDISAARLVKLRSRSEVKVLLQGQKLATEIFLAASDQEDSDWKSLQSKAFQAVAGENSKHAWPRFAFFTLRARAGLHDKAIRNLEYARDGYMPSLQIYQQLAEAYARKGRRAEAVATLQEAWSVFAKPAALYPDMIYHHKSAGQDEEAQSLSLECQLEYRDLKAACLEAAAGAPRN